MLSNRPYLLRAFHQWIVDSKCTPILVIDANHPRCKIPTSYVDGGEIVFNISQAAVRDLKMENESVQFKASFSGVIHIISAPIKAILAIYAEENGEGIFFDAEEADDSDGEGKIDLAPIRESNTIAASELRTKGRPELKLVE